MPCWHTRPAAVPNGLPSYGRSASATANRPRAHWSADSLFALSLKCGPWMIVGAHAQGRDDHDRPGALAFHALFVGQWAYRWIGADPFALAGALRHDWSAADRDAILPTVTWTAGGTRTNRPSTPASEEDPRLVPIVRALTEGHRVVVESSEPIDGLARTVWHALPRSVRRRATVAAWAFDNTNQFDLIGLPKLAGVSLGKSDVVFAIDHAGRYRGGDTGDAPTTTSASRKSTWAS